MANGWIISDFDQRGGGQQEPADRAENQSTGTRRDLGPVDAPIAESSDYQQKEEGPNQQGYSLELRRADIPAYVEHRVPNGGTNQRE